MLYNAAQAVSQATVAPYAPSGPIGSAPITTSSPTMAPAPAPTSAPAPVTVGADGRISGIDGMLDQISGALLRQAKTEILPTLQNDRELQTTVGRAIGKSLANPLWVMAGVAAVYVGWVIWSNSQKPRSNPARRSTRQRYSR